MIAPKLEEQFHVLWDRGFLPKDWGLTSTNIQEREIGGRDLLLQVSLISTVLMQILLNRLSTHGGGHAGRIRTRIPPHKEHHGRHIHPTTVVRKIPTEEGGKLLICFIDLTQAFDKVSCELL